MGIQKTNQIKGSSSWVVSMVLIMGILAISNVTFSSTSTPVTHQVELVSLGQSISTAQSTIYKAAANLYVTDVPISFGMLAIMDLPRVDTLLDQLRFYLFSKKVNIPRSKNYIDSFIRNTLNAEESPSSLQLG